MLKAIQRFFNDHIVTEVPEDDTSGGHESVPLAVCALLLEMAHVDGEFGEEEMADIINLMKEEFEVDSEQIHQLMALAQQEREEKIDLWQFTRLIHDRCDRGEKIRILETLWSVVYSDGILDAHEDYLMHKLASVLDLRHQDLIDAKLRILEGGNG
ncbi:MAG: TerB family tellurite resistance protein [Fidelibacterota bacterium]